MKTHEEHVARVKARHGDRLTVVGRYTHSKTKVDYSCPIHGTFCAFPANVESGMRCRKCANDARRTTPESHARQVRKVHGNSLIVVDDYVGAHTKIRYECPKHGIFLAAPYNVIHNQSGCRRCYEETIGPRSRKPHATYAKQASLLGVRVVDRYITAITPIRHQCKKGHTWSTSPNQLLSGYGCPLCDCSQYRRRPMAVGKRTVMLQGSEGVAVAILLSEGVSPADLAFTKQEGRPTFRYRFDGRTRSYIPDIFWLSERVVIEVKGVVTLGLYDSKLFDLVKAKAKAAIADGYDYRLMVIRKKESIDLGPDWTHLSWASMKSRFRRRTGGDSSSRRS